MGYVLVDNCYIRSCGVNTPVHLKVFKTRNEAEEIRLKLQKCRNQNFNIAFLYPLLTRKTKKRAKYLLAFEKRGTSLEEFLSPENIPKLIHKSYQVSMLYKQIIRSLINVGRSFSKQGLTCSFDLGNIFVVEMDNEMRVEVADFGNGGQVSKFDAGQGVEQWRTKLHSCLVDINKKLEDFQYSVREDAEMTKMLFLLKNDRSRNPMMKSTFFWDWEKKKDFIYTYYSIKQCNSSFDDQWIAKINDDPVLRKFFERYLSLLNAQQRPTPVKFVRSLFSHYHMNCKKIKQIQMESMEELLERLESILGYFTQNLVSNLIELEKFPLDGFNSFVNDAIWQ